MKSDHERFMRLAVDLARRGRESVSPNPIVGAVLVKRGRVVGRGWHRRFGGAHAEVEAIVAAGSKTRGADLYVSLEPCAHRGKTPPCSEAVVAAGILRVFFAARDPNPLTAGKGPRYLRRRGVRVDGGLLAAAAEHDNAPYLYWRRTGYPWVILKWAMSADGKIATRTRESQWITGERARAFAHRLRRRADAVIVGTETLRQDDPNLLPRPRRGRTPLRVLLDRRGRLPLRLQVFANDATPRLYVTTRDLTPRRQRQLAARGIDVLELRGRRGLLDLRALLKRLGARGVSQVLVEGGGALGGGFADARLVQEVAVFVAPSLIGGAAAPGPIGGVGVARVRAALQLEGASTRRLGNDLVLTGRVAAKRP